jgi:Mg-chelatase subunit ChlD
MERRKIQSSSRLAACCTFSEEVFMASDKFALKTLGLEALGLAAMGGLAFLYVNSQKDYVPPSPPPRVIKPAANQQDATVFVNQYQKDAQSVSDLAKTISASQGIDLITFVIDTSGSMIDDRQDLRDSIKTVIDRNRGRKFEVINFADTAEATGDPTRDLAELQRRIDQATDLGGFENSLLALRTAAERARGKFNNPLIVLMTDAAPNDGGNPQSQVTLDEAITALNASNAHLYIWAAFDQNEYQSAGSAATSDDYRQLIAKLKAGGQIYLVKRNGFDPNWFQQIGR